LIQTSEGPLKEMKSWLFDHILRKKARIVFARHRVKLGRQTVSNTDRAVQQHTTEKKKRQENRRQQNASHI
jgi:hypothetical protein